MAKPESGTEVLFLFDNSQSELLRRQINCNERLLMLSQPDVNNLRTHISTDGILPSSGGRFSREADLAPFALSGVPGISEGDIQHGNFGLIVVGSLFGSGSAREHAPRALIGAGVSHILVVGKSERIFLENCLNAGGPRVIEVEPNPNTVNKLVAEFINTEQISTPDLFADPVRLQISQSGGLLPFTEKRLRQEITIPLISHPELISNHPMTCSEKIIASHLVNLDPNHKTVIPGDIGFIGTDLRFSYEFMTQMIINLLKDRFSGDISGLINSPETIHLFEDHLVWAPEKFASLINSQRHVSSEYALQLHHQQSGLPGSNGICHTLIVEEGLAKPGSVVFGTDSHTCSAGVVNAFAFGGGASAMAASFLTGDTLIQVPQSINVSIEGQIPSGCSTKDIMLKILAQDYVRQGQAIGQVFEYHGSGLTSLTLDQLFVLTNMAVEGGATTGIVAEPIDAVVSHLSRLQNKSKSEITASFVLADPRASYAHHISIDLASLEPMVATPGHPTNGTPISSLIETSLSSGFIGSCTGGNLSDLQAVAEILKGKHTSIPLVVQVASMQIYNQAQKLGLIATIETAIKSPVLLPGCGACIGLGPGKINHPEDVIISDTNRNFPGRMGKPFNNGQEIEGGNVFLASAATVAASCLTGHITDPREFL